MSRLSQVERTCTTIHGRLVPREEQDGDRESQGTRKKEKERVSPPRSVSPRPYLSPRSGPVHGTSSATRTSGGRLNLGLKASTDYPRASSFLPSCFYHRVADRPIVKGESGARATNTSSVKGKAEVKELYKGLAGKGGRRRRGKKERRTDTRGGRLSGRPIGWQVYKEGKARRGKERRGKARQRKTTQGKALQGRQQASK